MIIIEPITSIVRVCEESTDRFPPFTAVCTITKAGIDTVRVTGLLGSLSLPHAIELGKKLKALGFKYAIWERIKDGECFDVKREL
jgi:hypothetical protein